MAKRTKKPRVGILMGSDSDWKVVSRTAETLDDFEVPTEVRVASAHRTPEEVAHYARTAQRRGVQVIIAAAGGAAHLAGVVASETTLPVVGIPLSGWALDGLDALLSTVQMPGGVPVATVAIGRAGAVNAAILAVQIMALSDPALRRKLQQYRRQQRAKVARANQEIQKDRSDQNAS